MRKAFFILLFALFTAVTFAQDTPDRIYTSEGDYYARIEYEGKYRGEQCLSYSHKFYFTNTLSNGQWEVVNRMLSKYKCTVGDTFTIHVGFVLPYGFDIVTIIVELTSNMRYRWWAFSTRLQ
jgi:hypothetical protein